MGGCADSNYPFLTSKERDNETRLDYFGARYYGSTQGRFTGADPIPVTKENFFNPQRWNLYAYVNNNPLAAVDPDGQDGQGKGGDKVISVFLGITTEERDIITETNVSTGDVREVGRDAPPWQKTKAMAPKFGYTLELLHGSRDVTGEDSAPIASGAFRSALKTSDLVVYVHHGRGDTSTVPFRQEYIQVGAMALTVNGARMSGSTITGDKPDASARAICNFSCNADRNGALYFNLVGKNQFMVTLNSNWDGVTGTSTIEKAVHAFVRTYVRTRGNIEKAAEAANKVLRKSAKTQSQNDGDIVEAKPVN